MKFSDFNHKTMRQFIYDDQFTLRHIALAMGCKKAVCIFENYDDAKMLKFISRCGFGKPKLLAVATMEV